MAIEYYERTLAEYPDCGLAKVALRMLKSLSPDDKEERRVEENDPNK